MSRSVVRRRQDRQRHNRRQDRQRYIRKKNGAPFASLVSQSGLRQHHTGAPAAYCFDIHTLSLGHWRGTMVTLSGTSRPALLRSASRLSAPEHHRYVRVLDWTVARTSTRTAIGQRALSAVNRRQSSKNLPFCRYERPVFRKSTFVSIARLRKFDRTAPRWWRLRRKSRRRRIPRRAPWRGHPSLTPPCVSRSLRTNRSAASSGSPRSIASSC